jgi:methenyltetrahydromethanopterin cyclohydrolase
MDAVSKEISVNQEAFKLVQKVLNDAERLRVRASQLGNGATVIDMGQRVPGSWLAGKYYAEITMGGVGEVTFETFEIDEYVLPAVRVTSAHPLLAGWVCQKHAEPLAAVGKEGTTGGQWPILTGPAKALLRPPDQGVRLAGYHDDSQVGVVSFQTNDQISDALAETVARACQIETQDLYIVVAPTTSLVCAIQVAARPIDQVMHRLEEEGFDIHAVHYATGRAPLPPLTSDELTAMGRINDCLLYGGSVLLYVHGDDQEIEGVISRIPTGAFVDSGKPFAQIYEEHEFDFHKMDLRYHSLALVQINNLATGSSFSAGGIDRAVLRRSFFGIV